MTSKGRWSRSGGDDGSYWNLKAIVFDDLEAELAGERKRKVRTLAGNFQSFSRNRWLFSPRQNPVWWQFLSHKVGRLVVPYALVGALFAAWLLPGPMYRLFALGQTGFYLVARRGAGIGDGAGARNLRAPRACSSIRTWRQSKRCGSSSAAI